MNVQEDRRKILLRHGLRRVVPMLDRPIKGRRRPLAQPFTMTVLAAGLAGLAARRRRAR